MSCPNHLEHKAHMLLPGPLRVRSRNIQCPQVQLADYSNCHILRRQALRIVLHMEDSLHRHRLWAVILKKDPGVAGETWLQLGASLEPLLQGVWSGELSLPCWEQRLVHPYQMVHL